jgi:16S rRNA (cytidine1402-2'-O)-methyltransferase
MKGTLYLVPSPIGNIDDVSPRAKQTLLNVDFVACEDTRNTLKLLNILGISKKCVSCHEHNESVASNSIISNILDGQNVAYLSDAGYPCISDPGYILAKKAIESGITVVPISGASAFLNALVGSGLDTKHFLFYGFLESKSSLRVKELEELKHLTYTLIFYEAPHRLDECIKDIYKVFGNRNVCLFRELTKIHEEFIRTNLKDLIDNPPTLKGEIVIIVDKGVEVIKEEISDKEIITKVNDLINNGLSKKDAIISVSILLNIPKNTIKKLVI